MQISLIQRGEPGDTRPPIHADLTDYHGRTMIRLEFPYDKTIIDEVRAIRGRVWSSTHKCWYVPDTGESRRRFDISDFEVVPNIIGEAMPVAPYQSVCQSLLDRMREKIILRALSPHTLKNYMNHIKVYLREVGKAVNPLDMTKADIEKYLLKRHKENPTSESDRNSHINAINPVGLKLE